MDNRQEVWDLGKEVIGMLKAQPPPRVDNDAGSDGQRRYVRAGGDRDTEWYFDASG